MKQVRLGVFETNSSSTHSLVICTKEEYEKWKSGELLYVDDTYPLKINLESKLVSQDKAKELIDAGVDDYNICDFESWSRENEEDVHYYTTKNGEELVIRCYYGHD